MWTSSAVFKEVNNRDLCEKSPNLVTLIVTLDHGVSKNDVKKV
jgi:hypothetical protein